LKQIPGKSYNKFKPTVIIKPVQKPKVIKKTRKQKRFIKR